MAIPSLAEVKTKVTTDEITPFEKVITERLETTATISYLEDPEQLNPIVIVEFQGKVLSEQGVEALIAAITEGGWTDAVVENRVGPSRQGIGISGGPAARYVYVSFKPAGTVEPGEPETP